MSARFAGKTVLITGAAGTLGRAAALGFAQEGATVAVTTARDEDGLKETVRLVEEAGGRAEAFVADVTQPADVAGLIRSVTARCGGLDVAFNNAAVFGTFAPVADYPEDVWEHVLAVNLTGIFLCMKHEIAYMRENGGGTIVNTSSNLGAHWRLPGASAYVAAKAGVSALTRNAAREHIADNIRINAISPGPIDSPMSLQPGETPAERAERMATALPIGRVATPTEIANAVRWLASPEAAFVVGQDHVIDGGATA
jgi:NAD(P)-dependent dehydrogenase (short-subunit alcohol dehydrogenase family)